MKKTLSLLAAFFCASVFAQAQTPKPANEQVVVPQVERRDVKLPRFPSKDIEVGLFAGVYSTESFGASGIAGVRLGYHITEDFFVQANLAQTKVSDEAFSQYLPGGGLFPGDSVQKLTYYNVSAGWNALPGEVFIGRNRAMASAIYLLGGIGSTKFIERRRQTFNLGVGLRVLFTDRVGLHMELRDHIFKTDITGLPLTTHNVEFSGGFAWYF